MTVKHNGSTVSVAGDSRITPLGAKLKHWKLDELPGLWDVLIGNMSLAIGGRFFDPFGLTAGGQKLLRPWKSHENTGFPKLEWHMI